MTNASNMTAEQVAVLADDIADLAEAFIQARDVTGLRNMATNVASLIRLHLSEIPANPFPAVHSADAERENHPGNTGQK